MGGAQAGEVASALAVEEFQQELPDQGSPEERLTDPDPFGQPADL